MKHYLKKKIIQQMQSSQQETLAFSYAAVEIELFMWKPKWDKTHHSPERWAARATLYILREEFFFMARPQYAAMSKSGAKWNVSFFVAVDK